MSKAIITIGSSTTHGGTVSEVSNTFSISGQYVHLHGMKHYCPTCKTTVSALAADTSKSVNGLGIVVNGDKTSCGASFIATQATATIG